MNVFLHFQQKNNIKENKPIQLSVGNVGIMWIRIEAYALGNRAKKTMYQFPNDPRADQEAYRLFEREDEYWKEMNHEKT